MSFNSALCKTFYERTTSPPASNSTRNNLLQRRFTNNQPTNLQVPAASSSFSPLFHLAHYTTLQHPLSLPETASPATPLHLTFQFPLQKAILPHTLSHLYITLLKTQIIHNFPIFFIFTFLHFYEFTEKYKRV
ncbi:hypothetical protein O9A_00035 [Bartonella koehlerae C-29]|uniref:Uncharacterized protein n=1 Tax=Bartonella koehlerae C-29 TaxID=1134510 RepID=A0A067WCA5_9HYPH|nr:hypothetical protein O9A_00035 [Bartonella koehlerae C-29]